MSTVPNPNEQPGFPSPANPATTPATNAATPPPPGLAASGPAAAAPPTTAPPATAPPATIGADGVPRFANGKPAVDEFGQPVSARSRLAATLLCFFLGGLGIHRFYVGKIGTGILMIVTLGGLGIWVLIDLIMILVGSFRDKQELRLINW